MEFLTEDVEMVDATNTADKRNRSTSDSDSTEGVAAAKRQRKTPGGDEWRVRVENSATSPLLKAVDASISKILPVSPTSVCLKLSRNMTRQQVRAIVKDYNCGEEISRMDWDESRDQPKAKTSYYTFTVAGDTFAERLANVRVIVLEFLSSGNIVSDIHFFKPNLTDGCIVRRNDNTESQSCLDDDKLVTDVEEIDQAKYRSLTRPLRKTNHNIRFWICILPYYARDGAPPPTDVTEKDGISGYCLFDNGVGIFEFDSRRITPAEAVEAMGGVHRSLCFPSSGNAVKKLLADFESKNNDVTALASAGELNYRHRWQHSDKRPTKCVRFYSLAEDKKLTDRDILDVVNTEGLFRTVHFREDRAYGVAEKVGKEKIVPASIELSDNTTVRFTAITFEEFRHEKASGMNSLSTWRRGAKAKTFAHVPSTRFAFRELPEASVRRMTGQKRVTFLKAVKDEENEDKYFGVVKTSMGVKSCNLAPRNCGTVIPQGKEAFRRNLDAIADLPGDIEKRPEE